LSLDIPFFSSESWIFKKWETADLQGGWLREGGGRGSGRISNLSEKERHQTKGKQSIQIFIHKVCESHNKCLQNFGVLNLIFLMFFGFLFSKC